MMKQQYPCIQTCHLILHPLESRDAPALHRIYQSEGVLKYFPNPVPPPLERIQQFIDRQQAHWRQYGYGNWRITLVGEYEMIGWAGLQYLTELGESEVGFLLDRPLWGKGYATEAAYASLRFGFANFSLDHIIALVHPDNLASRRVVEKCGMELQNSIQLWSSELMRYVITKSAWQRLDAIEFT